MKRKIIAIIVIVTLTCLCGWFIYKHVDEQILTFEEFKQEFNYSIVGDDIKYWNSVAVDPSNLGYDRDDDVLAKLDEYKDYKTTQKEDNDELNKLLAHFSRFNRDQLDDVQKEEYDVIDFRLNLLKEMLDPSCKWYPLVFDYISQYGGVLADFISSMDNYNLRNEQDVIDMIDYFQSSDDALGTYDDYVRDRAEDGIPLSDYTLDKMIEYLDGITDKGQDFYLYDVLSKKISNADFLKKTDRVTYKEQLILAMDGCFMPGCKQLSSDLAELKGYWTDPEESYTAHYSEQYAGYYEWKLRSTLGVAEINPEEYGASVYNLLDKAYKEYGDIIDEFENPDGKNYDAYQSMYNDEEKCFGCNTYNEIMDYLLENSEDIVAPIENCPEIVIKEEDETKGESASYLAYYVTSPYDEKYSSEEKITYNPYKGGSAAGKLFTFAHEGYPGHLYAHVLSKQQGCSAFVDMNSTLGSSEGWAQYAAFSVLNNISEKTDDPIKSVVAKYTAVSYYCNYLNSALIDYFVNYYCLNASELAEAFNVSVDEAKENIMHYCDENIANMSCYSYAFAKMLEAHDNAKENAAHYDEQEFNRYIITHYGMFGLDKLKTATESYINDSLSKNS